MERNILIFGTGASSCKDYDGLVRVMRMATENNILCFDTAPSYHTEEVMGRVLHEIIKDTTISRENLFIQTKIDAWQMQESNGEISGYVEGVLKKLKFDYLDSLLIHWPIPEYLDNTWRSFVKLYERGLVKKIGICNLRLRHLKKMLTYEFVPQIIQIERNPLRTCEPEINFCQGHNIDVQAYSPLCKMDERIRDNEILREIAQKYKKNVGQIVLRWHLDTGVIPIFTTTKTERVKEYVEIYDFQLSDNEVKAVSSLNIDYKMYLESCLCPGL